MSATTKTRPSYRATSYKLLVYSLGQIEKNAKLKINTQKTYEKCINCDVKLYNLRDFYKHIESVHPEDRLHKYNYNNNNSILSPISTLYPKHSAGEEVKNDVDIKNEVNNIEMIEIVVPLREEEAVNPKEEIIVVDVDAETLNFKSAKSELSFMDFTQSDLIDSLVGDQRFKKLMNIVFNQKLNQLPSDLISKLLTDMLEWDSKDNADYDLYKSVVQSEKHQLAYIRRSNQCFVKPKIHEIHSAGFEEPFRYSTLPLVPLCQKALKNKSLSRKIFDENKIQPASEASDVIRSKADAQIFARIKGKCKLELVVEHCRIATEGSDDGDRFLFIYATFADIPLHHRADCKHLELILMANRCEMERRNVQLLNVLEHLRAEAEYLATNGIKVMVDGKLETIKVTISGLLGESFAICELMGFDASFYKSGNCRDCGASNLDSNFHDCQPIRPLINSNSAQVNLNKTIGQLGLFPFEGIDGITRWNISPPDLVLELSHVLRLILELILTSLVCPKSSNNEHDNDAWEALLDSDVVERQFENFNFYYDPPKLVWTVDNGYRLTGNSIQIFEAFLKLDVILFDELKQEWLEFQLFLCMKQFALNAFAQTFNSTQFNNLNVQFMDVLKHYRSVQLQVDEKFRKTNSLDCKLDRLAHYADFIKHFGPLCEYSNCAYVRRNHFPKCIESECKSFFDPALTITMRHQAMRALMDDKIGYAQIDFFKASQLITKQLEQLYMDVRPSICLDRVTQSEHPFKLGKNIIRKLIDHQNKHVYWFHVQDFLQESGDQNGRICCKGDILKVYRQLNYGHTPGSAECYLRNNSLVQLQLVHTDKYVWLQDLDNSTNNFVHRDVDHDKWYFVGWVN